MMPFFKTFLLLYFLIYNLDVNAQNGVKMIRPSRSEIIRPVHKDSFRTSNCPERIQGGNPRMINGYQVFSGSMDGYRQVDPQIAVGEAHILHGSNSGLVIYNKEGAYIQGVSQSCFNDGIDPKLFYDIHNKFFAFDLWEYWNEPTKPIHISVSENSDPTGAWNTYPIPAPYGVDGGGIGYSKKWIGYSFPGGNEETFVLRAADAKAGKSLTVFHFSGSLGHPVFTQDDTSDLYFFEFTDKEYIIRKVSEDQRGNPFWVTVHKKQHKLKYYDYPPQSPQKETKQKVSSGDRNPKNLVIQNGCLWFSQAVNCEERAAVQWHQISLKTGDIVQSGLIKSDSSNYIQTTIAVNKNNDVLIGFQQVDENSFISPRFAYRLSDDPPGSIRGIVHVGEGIGAADGEAWGDYSSSVIDGDNLLDLWTIQSIANKEGKGETVIVKVPFKK